MAMAKREELMQITEEVARHLGVELYWLNDRRAPGRWHLQVMIDKAGGVTLGDCERVSRALEDLYDERIEHSYELEVSSPGIDRPLHTERHFNRAVGEQIRVKTYGPIRGRRVWTGTLTGYAEGEQLRLDTPQGFVEIPTAQVADARVSPDLNSS